MNRELKNMRESYTKGSLTIADIDKNPILQFKQWMHDAQLSNIAEPNAMILSTVSSEGIPSSRTVLLKDIDDDGFVFYTNYRSHKANEIDANENVAVVFLWKVMERQIRFVGKAHKVSRERSKEYFQSRPKNSQLGAWVSEQSQVIADRKALESKLEELKTLHAEDEVLPLPDFWGGYKIVPYEYEFWQGRRSRLHDRIRYKKVKDAWSIDRLAP